MKKIFFLSIFIITVVALFSIINIDQVAYATSLPDGSSCISSSECQSEFCYFTNAYLAGICCQSYQFCCGNHTCNSEETCSSCPADCGLCGPVCGNGSCESEESCSSCRSDCGECKKSSGSSCYGNSECFSNYCVHMVCRASSVYCGDAHCDSGESCSSCSPDCGSCAPVLKSNNSSCSYDSECSSSNCVHGYCRSSSYYCGDSYCDSGESCFSCSSDCGSCQEEEVVKKADGEYCDKGEECTSGNCQNYRCCPKNKTCCLSHLNCSSAQYCSEERSFCLPDLPTGQSCTEKEQCESGNCENNICCDWGQICCKNHSDCDKNDYCQQETYYCRDKWSLGSTCGDYGLDMCLSGYCDPDTWECAEKPAGAAESTSPAPAATTETETTNIEEAIIISADDLSLKECEEGELSIRIRNRSQKEITLDDRLLIENFIPYNIDIQKSTLQIFKTKLLPGEMVSTKSEAGQGETIEGATFDTCKRGSGSSGAGVIKLKLVYFVDNRAKWAESDLNVLVSASHIQKEETASRVFNETMIWEGREVDYTNNEKEYIFVSVENKSLQQAAINEWQVAHEETKKAAANIKDDFAGTLKPEVVSFFETIKSLEEAKSYQGITEASIRAIAPPAIVVGFDFANLLDAIEKQKNVERGLLTHFNATDFVTVPLYDSQKNITGYTKVIAEEENGKFYAVKIGDL